MCILCRARFFRFIAVAAAVTAMSCGSSPIIPTPAPVVTSALPTTGKVVAYELTGVVTGDDGRRIADARVNVNFLPAPGAHFSGVSGVTDDAGRYNLKFSAVPGGYLLQSTALVNVAADGYEGEYGWFGPLTADPQQSLDLHPHLIRQIFAGESVDVTVAPGDTSCLNNVQDLGDSYVCRIVRIVAPSDGVLTIEVLPTEAGGPVPTLETEPVSATSQINIEPDLGTPRSMRVTAGTVIKASVEMLLGETTSHTFTLKTSITPQ